ncbi:LysR family transcriptional regulator [Parendozoicomonas sp. Alg238-R29]|uniref:LysR family transcriptional regulator n=1 Tax=Parendozoicomonas sp. Alg238-R29 TaxID=2993446 RepID=UPI00248D6936|nr:LysR family transcriptional regulator [Parendozoicomonas sp. Alg238-R29]
MHISKLDLNLLVVVDVIASAGSITAAAKELNLTQPAVSHALARIREQLGDPLFVREGHSMRPTPYAREILPELRKVLNHLDTTLGRKTGFDPLSSDHSFTIAMHDSLEPGLLPVLVEDLQRQAPNISLVSVKLNRRDIEKELKSGQVDLVADVFQPVGEQVIYAPLQQEDLVVVARCNHPRINDGLNLDQYLAEKHVLVSSRRRGPGYEDNVLAREGLRRLIALRARNHLAACQVVDRTDLLLTLPSHYAEQAGHYLSLKTLSLPWKIEPVCTYLYWHVRMGESQPVQWLRERLLALVGDVKV